MTDPSSLPYDLKGYAQVKLSAFDNGTLRQICQERSIQIGPRHSKADIVAAILEWKKELSKRTTKRTPTRGGPSQHPPPAPPPSQSRPPPAAVVSSASATTGQHHTTTPYRLPTYDGLPAQETRRPEDVVGITIGRQPTSAAEQRDRKQSSGKLGTAIKDFFRNLAPKKKDRRNKPQRFVPPVIALSNDRVRAGKGGEEPPVVIISHNIKDFSSQNENIEERIRNLCDSYRGDWPDILVIQEVKSRNSPTTQLAKRMSSISGRRYVAQDSGLQNNRQGECTGFIFDCTRVSLTSSAIGVPLYDKSNFVRKNLAVCLPQDLALRCGFSASELSASSRRFAAAGQVKPLFCRMPVYATFSLHGRKKALVIVSVHLHPDPSVELGYVRDLLPHEPPLNVDFVVCGDFNLTNADSEDRMYAAVGHDRGYLLALDPKVHVTNLGRSMLAAIGGQSHCYDNFMVARTAEVCCAKVLELPAGFIPKLLEETKKLGQSGNSLEEDESPPALEWQRRRKIETRQSTRENFFRNVVSFYSDHRAIYLELC